MNISVADDDWGGGRPSDIEALLCDCAAHLTKHLRESFDGSIVVRPGTGDSPMALYRSGDTSKPFTIELTARNWRWAQYTYQFAHELCHVLCNFESRKGNPNLWLEESLCEVASMFCLRGMARSWQTSAPFPNWADYASALQEYADEETSSREFQVPSGVTLAEWIFAREKRLRRNAVQRPLNKIIAYSILPLFETQPSGWNAVGALPSSTGMLESYVAEWERAVDHRDKPFVAGLAQVLLPG